MEKGFGTPWVDSIQELCPFVRFGVVGAAAHWLFVAGAVERMKLWFDGRNSEIHVAFAMEEVMNASADGLKPVCCAAALDTGNEMIKVKMRKCSL